MNNQQRKYLVDKINKSVDEKLRVLRDSEPEYPSIKNYLFHAAMKGDLKVRPVEELEEMFRQRALKSKSGRDWLANTHAFGNSGGVNLEYDDIFIIPDEPKRLIKEHEETMRRLREEQHNIRVQADGLITRITLASDKTLQTMINEVDDMGDISLMDTKLKLLTK